MIRLLTVFAVLSATAVATPAGAAPRTVPQAVRTAATTPDPNHLTTDQALTQAKQTGQPVIATALTTPVGQTTANPNGTVTLTQSNQPARTRRNGTWVNLDATLVRNTDGSYSPAATTGALTLSGGGTGPLVTMSAAGHQLALTFPVSLPTPTVSGTAATYPNVLPNVDLVVMADQQGGFADTLVVKTAAAAANPALTSLHMGMTSRDLTISSNAAGSLAMTDPSGHTVYSSPTALMWDSTPAPAGVAAVRTPSRALVAAAGSAAIDSSTGLPLASSSVAPGENAQEATVGVSADASGFTLTPDKSVLTGANIVYPVYIDPSITLNPDSYGAAADWTEVESGNTGYAGWHQSGLEQVGDCAWPGCGTVGVARSYFQWNIAPLYGTRIISSQANFTEVYSPACSAGGHDGSVWLEWTWGIGSGTNWNNKPGIIGTIGGNSGMYGHDSSCGPQGIGWDVTSQVISGVNGRSGTTTFGLEAGNEGDAYSWKQFSDTATLTTTYDVTPATPIWPNATPGGCTTAAPYAIIGKTDVALGVTTLRAADNVAKPLNVTFHVVNVATGQSIYGSNADPVVQTTAGSTVGLAVSSSALPTGDYSWTVQAYDGFLSSGWMPACYLHVDTTQPAPPTISSTDYLNNKKATVPVRTPSTFTFTPGAGSSTPTAYRYQLNSGLPVTVPATNGSWSGTITPTRLTNTLTVQALSAAGTPSGRTTWTIEPAFLTTPDPDGDFTGSGHPDVLAAGGTGGTTEGLWLSTTSSTGQLSPATNIGLRGTAITDANNQPVSWTGAIITHGQFTDDGMQDLLAILPNGSVQIYSNPGDGSALNGVGDPAPRGLLGDTFTDTNGFPLTADSGETITQLTAVGQLPQSSSQGAVNVAFPDLVAVVHDTQVSPAKNELWLLPHAPGVGNYQNAAVELDASIDWSTKTILGAAYQGQPALLVRDNSNGEVDRYTCTTSACTTDDGWFANTSKAVMHTTDTATDAAHAPLLASEDANNDGIPDLWALSPTGAGSYGAGATTGLVTSLASAGTVIPAASAGLVPMGAVEWTTPSDDPNAGHTQVDVYAADPSGNLWDYQRMPSGQLGPPTLAATGHWNNFTVFGVVDFNHDGYPDIIVRDNATCNENVYLGSASGLATTPVQFGVGWCGYTPYGIEDWDGDQHFDILAREDDDGVMWLYPGDLTSKNNNGTRYQIGGGWTNGVYDPWGVIDFNGDGYTDIITRYEPTDALKMYVGNGTGGGYPSGGTQIGGGENAYTFFGMLDYDNNTAEPDLIMRNNTPGPNLGHLELFKGTGTGGWTAAGYVDIATGW